MVRIGGGHGKAGTDVDEQVLPILLRLTKDGELTGKLDIGKPGLEEIGAEGNEKIGLVDAIVRYLGEAEDDLIRLSQRLVRKGLIR